MRTIRINRETVSFLVKFVQKKMQEIEKHSSLLLNNLTKNKRFR